MGWARAGAVVAQVAVCAPLLLGCSSPKPRECRTESGATICLVTAHPHSYVLEASGLKPGSSVPTELAGPHVDAAQGPPLTLTVDARGHLSGANGLTAPAGAGPATLTIRGTSATGAPVVVTFTR